MSLRTALSGRQAGLIEAIGSRVSTSRAIAASGLIRQAGLIEGERCNSDGNAQPDLPAP
jgi:hypothetical protein